jgi:hypothetical protein
MGKTGTLPFNITFDLQVAEGFEVLGEQVLHNK